MSGSHTELSQQEKQANKRFLVAKEGRKYEIDKFWQRSSFFWVFIAAAFVAYGKADPSDRFAFACFGIVSSFAWTLQNRGSKYWQEAWEQKLERTEMAALGGELFHVIEPKQRKGLWGAQRFSVSRLTISISDFSVIVWFALMLFASHIFDDSFRAHWRGIYTFVLVATILYCGAIIRYAHDWPKKVGK